MSALVLAGAVHARDAVVARDDTDAYTEPSTNCHDIHIFMARGNNEVAGASTRQTSVVQAICDGRKSCGWEDIDYDNPTDNKYAEACYEGAVNGLKQIRSYGEDCPDSKLVLTGYSQGAHVIGDMLGGGGGTFETMGGGEHMGEDSTEEYVEGLDQNSSPGDQIVAAFLWGDTRHVAGQAYEALDGGDFEGWYPRNETEIESLNKWSDILRSWCDARDGVCAYDTTATVNYTYHWNYLDLYSQDAADWLSIKLGEKENTTATATASSSSSSATATSSSSSTGGGK
ncbi:Alpha/Beta hydrolase protein [Diaporthe sp. PMI_573]|nr:Alpha/Beta hydrolase protein [Diaporthaceae sp. PMI_573]